MANTNLNGKTLVVASYSDPPYTYLKTHENGTSLFAGGIEVEILNALSSYFKFKYQIAKCDYNSGKIVNETWTGVIGNILALKADFGIAGISWTYERSQVIQYSKTYLYSPLTYITRPPGHKPPVTLILEPFTVPVWINVLFALLFVIITQRIIVHKIIKDKKSDISWPLICLLRQNRPKHFPSFTSIRLIYLFWSFACLVIGIAYSTFLYSTMTIPMSLPTIDTIEKLAHEQKIGKIKVLGIANTSYYRLIKNSKSGILHEIGKHLVPLSSNELAFDLVRNSTKTYAFISTRYHLLFNTISSPPKSYYFPPESKDSSFFSNHKAMVMHKEFPYINHFNNIISIMMSNGLISFWEKNAFRKFKLKELKNHKKKNQDDVHSVDNNDDDVAILSLNMSQLQSSYYFMVTEISISFLALFIEIGIYKRKRNGIKK